MEEVPFDERYVPRAEIDWERSAWWWYPLTRAIHPAVKMTSLAVSLLAIGAAKLGVTFADWIINPGWQAVEAAGEPRGLPFSSPLLVWLGDLIQSILSLQQFALREVAFISFVTLWLAGVFSIFGGVIARRGLVELGQRTVAGWGESMRIVVGRWQSFLWATGMHLVGISVLLVPALLLGLVSRLGGIGAGIAGVLLVATFPIVFGVGRMALSMFLCFPLSVCAIAAEKKADAFEGFSRSNAYLFQRPVVALICGVFLFAIGLVGEQLVYWTLTLGWGAVRSAYFATGGSIQPASETYVQAGNWLATSLVQAYWFSFFWSGSAALYLVLRKSVDHTDLDELDSIANPIETSMPEIPSTPPVSSTDAEPSPPAPSPETPDSESS